MNDQERITDLILTEKKMSANYDTFASECVNVQLRDEFLKLLQPGPPRPRPSSFQTAQAEGWYQVEQAPASQIGTAYTRSATSAPSKPIHGARPFTGLALFKVETG